MMAKRGAADPSTTMKTDQSEGKLDIREQSKRGKPKRKLRDETPMSNPLKSFGYSKGN